MPCWETRTISQNLTAGNRDLLAQTIKGLGWEVSLKEETIIFHYGPYGEYGQVVNNQITVKSGDEEIIDQVRRAYTSAVVSTAAKRFGFHVIRGVNPQHVVLQRRR